MVANPVKSWSQSVFQIPTSLQIDILEIHIVREVDLFEWINSYKLFIPLLKALIFLLLIIRTPHEVSTP